MKVIENLPQITNKEETKDRISKIDSQSASKAHTLSSLAKTVATVSVNETSKQDQPAINATILADLARLYNLYSQSGSHQAKIDALWAEIDKGKESCSSEVQITIKYMEKNKDNVSQFKDDWLKAGGGASQAMHWFGDYFEQHSTYYSATTMHELFRLFSQVMSVPAIRDSYFDSRFWGYGHPPFAQEYAKFECAYLYQTVYQGNPKNWALFQQKLQDLYFSMPDVPESSCYDSARYSLYYYIVALFSGSKPIPWPSGLGSIDSIMSDMKNLWLEYVKPNS